MGKGEILKERLDSYKEMRRLMREERIRVEVQWIEGESDGEVESQKDILDGEVVTIRGRVDGMRRPKRIIGVEVCTGKVRSRWGGGEQGVLTGRW